MPLDLTPFTPDCGHTVTPTPLSIGTGKATDPATGRTMCYPCAEAWEQEKIKTATVHTCYVSSDSKRLTTWTGATLAVITSYGVGSKRYTPSNGTYRMRTLRARTPDGADWYGSGSNAMDAITIRRLKNTA